MKKHRTMNTGAVRVLKVGEFDLITPGHDKPGEQYPSKCGRCRKAIKDGDLWRDHFNGEYHVIFHVGCEWEIVHSKAA